MTNASGTREIRRGVDKVQARSTDQVPAVQVVPVQMRSVCWERQRETERESESEREREREREREKTRKTDGWDQARFLGSWIFYKGFK